MNDGMYVVKLCLALFLANLSSTMAKDPNFPTPEFLELLKPVVIKCEEDTKVDKKFVDEFNDGVMHEDYGLKCYMKCLFLEFEVLDSKTGKFDYEKMFSLIPEEMKSIAYKIGKDCMHFQGEDDTDLCELSYDLHRCWQKSDPEHYFIL